MLWKLLLLLIVVPIAELLVLVKLTQATNIWLTLAIVFGTGIAGAVLARMEGLRILGRIQRELAEGRMPGDSLLDGLLVLIAAALLITPGLITDAAGLLLLLPPTRALARSLIKHWIKRKMNLGQAQFYRSMGFRPIRNEPPPGFPPVEDEKAEN